MNKFLIRRRKKIMKFADINCGMKFSFYLNTCSFAQTKYKFL